MCLYSYEREMKRTKGIGYKVFKHRNGLIFSQYGYHEVERQPTARPTNVWLSSTPQIVYADTGHYYQSGWHIFTRRRDAERYAEACSIGTRPMVVRRVKYQHGMYLGVQQFGSIMMPVVVAKEIMILEA